MRSISQQIAPIVSIFALLLGVTSAFADLRMTETTADDPNPRLAINRTRDLTNEEARAVYRQLARGTQLDALRVLGHPHQVHRIDAREVRWSYKLGPGYMTIRIRDKKIEGVYHNERQTGVREDDFVGLIRP